MIRRFRDAGSWLGWLCPALGVSPLAAALVSLTAVSSLACGDNERTRVLPPEQVAMDHNVEPVYMEGAFSR